MNVTEVVNVFEMEGVARRKLPEADYAAIAGSDRRAFDRITFRPRMLVNARQLDLSTELFGERLFAPILVGPASRQRRAHPEAELAMARGAAAAKTALVVSSRSSYPLEEIASALQSRDRQGAVQWYQSCSEADRGAVRKGIEQAVKTGCKAVCLTLGVAGRPGLDWGAIDELRRGARVPFLLKGIMSPEEARTAAERGIEGIVVSNHGGRFAPGFAAPIEMLPSIVDAVAGKAVILIDGSFRRGTDILKALALGARAVLVTRPVLWGLAAYGAEGVQTVLEMLQTELARSMAMAGTPNVPAISRNAVRIHRR
jgi:isopentenyl diphosphate isomerase/L-lactate dehydrogenase-like FMN-dependent dehydrogenase